ncbi:hypothetical protein [Micromonospora sp. NPDC051296]|uniref:hypothetical protein n=1 Tax=Micromonospora sp. NPDC051296 TaxID=3155046 RepID=UPI00343B7793
MLGLQQNGMLTGQAICAALAGAVADLMPTHRAVAVLAGLSLVCTLLLTRGLRRTRPVPDAPRPAAEPARS